MINAKLAKRFYENQKQMKNLEVGLMELIQDEVINHLELGLLGMNLEISSFVNHFGLSVVDSFDVLNIVSDNLRRLNYETDLNVISYENSIFAIFLELSWENA